MNRTHLMAAGALIAMAAPKDQGAAAAAQKTDDKAAARTPEQLQAEADKNSGGEVTQNQFQPASGQPLGGPEGELDAAHVQVDPSNPLLTGATLDADTERLLAEFERSTSTVVVGCKLPQGYDLGNGIVLNGSNHPSAREAGGFGITSGVPADFMDKWMENHKDLGPVKNGLIIGGKSADHVRDQGRERSSVLNGFEQSDPAQVSQQLAEEEDTAAQRAAEARL